MDMRFFDLDGVFDNTLTTLDFAELRLNVWRIESARSIDLMGTINLDGFGEQLHVELNDPNDSWQMDSRGTSGLNPQP